MSKTPPGPRDLHGRIRVDLWTSRVSRRCRLLALDVTPTPDPEVRVSGRLGTWSESGTPRRSETPFPVSGAGRGAGVVAAEVSLSPCRGHPVEEVRSGGGPPEGATRQDGAHPSLGRHSRGTHT